MMITDSQATRYGSRSRSRSRGSQTRPIARSRSVPATSMVPRSLRYNGECRFTRSVPFLIAITSASGFRISATDYKEFILTFSPIAVTAWGSNVNYLVTAVPNASEISGLWERVKIDKVELTLMNDTTDPVTTGTIPTTTSPEIMLCNDFVGPTGGSTTTIERILQDPSAKSYQLNGNRPAVKWTVRPKYQRLIQYTSINSSFEPATGFVASDTDIPHYGTRIGILNPGSVGASRLSVIAKIFYSCNNVK